MDQLTTFMDGHLESTRRFSDDKLLTKTMINNYTKNKKRLTVNTIFLTLTFKLLYYANKHDKIKSNEFYLSF